MVAAHGSMRGSLRPLVALSVAVLSVCATSRADAIVLFRASGGGVFGRTEIFGTKEDTRPQTVDTGDFGHGGAYCAAVGTPDYICARYFAEAGLAGGRRLTLRALARVERRNAATFPGGALIHGVAQVSIYGMTGSVASPVSYAYINLGLSGTRAMSTNNGNVTVQAFSTVSLNGVPVQCDGSTACAPVKVPNFDPAGGLVLSLRVDAAIANPQGASGYDAAAVADYSDTLELLAIEPRDANDQPIPGAYYTIPDVNGEPYVIPTTPETTSTTVAGATTTTTTTLPPGCVPEATTASVRCRLDALAAAVQTAATGSLGTKLQAKLAAARASLVKAEALVAGPASKRRKALRKTLKQAGAFAKLLGSKKARRTIDEATRTALGAPVPVLDADLRALLAAASSQR